jgi:hypothetical protein
MTPRALSGDGARKKRGGLLPEFIAEFAMSHRNDRLPHARSNIAR